MKKVLRKNLVIDFGKTIDQLGSELIHTPDQYKRINNIGTIVLVGEGCQYFTHKDINKKVIVGQWNRMDCRFSPKAAKSLGLKERWHFIVPEQHIECLLE